jgi:hypothetical protein
MACLPEPRAPGEPYEGDTANRRDDAGTTQPPLPVLSDLPHRVRNSAREGCEKQAFDRENEAERGKKISHFAARPGSAMHQLFAGGAGAARETEGCDAGPRPEGSLKYLKKLEPGAITMRVVSGLNPFS